MWVKFIGQNWEHEIMIMIQRSAPFKKIVVIEPEQEDPIKSTAVHVFLDDNKRILNIVEYD